MKFKRVGCLKYFLWTLFLSRIACLHSSVNQGTLGGFFPPRKGGMASLAAAVNFSVKSSRGQSDSKIFRSIDLENRSPKGFQLAFLQLYRGWVVLSSACDVRNIGSSAMVGEATAKSIAEVEL